MCRVRPGAPGRAPALARPWTDGAAEPVSLRMNAPTGLSQMGRSEVIPNEIYTHRSSEQKKRRNFESITLRTATLIVS